MEIKEFETGLVKYYGKHQSEHVTKVTMKYVHSNYNKTDYSSLMQAIMKSHPFNYGFPDVAAMEDAQDKLWKKDGRSLRKSKPATDWENDILSITDNEREEAEKSGARETWEELLKKDVNKRVD